MNHVAKIAHGFLAVLAVILSIATVASLFARYHWVFDTAANLRVQGLIAIAVLGAMALLLQQWWMVGIAAGLMLVNLSMMNFGSLEKAEDFADSTPLRIVTTNVLTSNPRHDDIIEELRAIDADVMVVIELSTELAERLRDAFHESHPHLTFHERDLGNFGIGILSRIPLRSVKTLRLDGGPITLEAILDDYRIVATHPLPPVGQANFISRNRQLQMLATQMRSGPERPRRTILAGDLNLTPWNANFTDLLSSAGLRRAAPRWGLRPTWYAFPSFPFGLQIDHVLISDDLACTNFQIGHACGSDHRSVSVTLYRRDR